MALSVIFGDDEHTAADGPYNRLLKARKWLYVSAAIATALSSNIYQPSAIVEVIKIVAMPVWFLGPAMVGVLAYLLIQYTLLYVQLRAVYDIVLKERFVFRRADELSKARLAIGDAKLALDSERRRLSTAHADRARSLTELDRLRKNRDDLLQKRQESSGHVGATNRVIVESGLLSAIKEAEARLEANPFPDPRQLPRLEEAIDVAQRAYDQLTEENPANRARYVDTEKTIDALRVLTPLVVAFLSLVKLGLHLGRVL